MGLYKARAAIWCAWDKPGLPLGVHGTLQSWVASPIRSGMVIECFQVGPDSDGLKARREVGLQEKN